MAQEKRGLFKKAAMPLPVVPPAVNAMRTRTRLVEEKLSNLNRKVEFLENNFVASNRRRNEVVQHLNSDVVELKRDIDDIKQKMGLIIRELKLTAGKDDLNELQSYLDIWDLTRFISRSEVEKMIDEKMRK
jgi:hypothetical protein